MPLQWTIRTAALGAALLVAGCSGSGFYQRTDTEAGSSIIYDQAIFRAVERIIMVCGNPTLQPGDDRFRGADFFLGNCPLPGPGQSRNLTALTDGQPQPQRLASLALLLGGIDEPLAAPVPTTLPGFETRREARLLTWLLPGLDNALNQQDMPDLVRDGLRAVIRPLLAGAQCEFVASVAIDLLPLRLTGVALSWRRVQGAAILRLHASFAEAPPEARARLTSSIKCLGSTQNPANGLLHVVLPNGPHDVNLAGANLTADYEIKVAPPAAGQTTNSLRMTLRDLTFTMTRLDIQPIGNPIGDSMMTNALAEAKVTRAGVARQVEGKLRGALAPLADKLAPILLASLDLEKTATRPAREVVGVEVEPSSVPREDQIRFESRRTDKICATIPNVGLVCVDPISPTKPGCFKVPNFGTLCTPKKIDPRP